VSTTLTDRLDSTDEVLTDAPISAEAVEALLAARPELRMDGSRPTVEPNQTDPLPRVVSQFENACPLGH
jgi:hypothetical protein